MLFLNNVYLMLFLSNVIVGEKVLIVGLSELIIIKTKSEILNRILDIESLLIPYIRS